MAVSGHFSRNGGSFRLINLSFQLMTRRLRLASRLFRRIGAGRFGGTRLRRSVVASRHGAPQRRQGIMELRRSGIGSRFGMNREQLAQVTHSSAASIHLRKAVIHSRQTRSVEPARERNDYELGLSSLQGISAP